MSMSIAALELPTQKLSWTLFYQRILAENLHQEIITNPQPLIASPGGKLVTFV